MSLESRMVKKTLDPLFGKDITLKTSKPLEVSDKIVVGSYINGDGQITGAVLMDYAYTCYTAAALSMMPADVARECIDNGDIEEGLRDNL